jgi:hypothetical protein
MKVFILILLILFLFSFVNSYLHFEIQPDRQKCFIEELFKGSVMMAKWKFYGVDDSDEEVAKKFYSHMQILIMTLDGSKIFKREFLPTSTGKISFHSEDEGFYKICVNYHGSWTVPFHAFMSLKINSDNMDEPDLKSAVKDKDLDPIHEKFVALLDAGNNLIQKQTNETFYEDEAASTHIHTTKNYYYMTVIQVLVILSVGIYQIFKFRKFLVSNNVI